MADTYGTIVGFVQFDPNTREYNGENLTDVVVRSVATQENVRVTVWPEFQVSLDKGDFVAVDGKVQVKTYKTKTGEEKTGKQLSATNIVVMSPVPKKGSKVVSDIGV